MWDTTKQQQLNELRWREEEGVLTDGERQILDHLVHEIDHEEWGTLRPIIERLRQEQTRFQEESSRLKAQNIVLAVLAEQYEDLLARARVQLAGLLSEHEALKVEYERVTGQPLIVSSS